MTHLMSAQVFRDLPNNLIYPLIENKYEKNNPRECEHEFCRI